jgi:uncharacterized membrane protein YbhN (UPF0104 family)
VSEREAASEDILDERTAGRKLVHGLIAIAVLAALAVGLILAVPGLRGVGRIVAHMKAGWIAVAIGLEVLSCLGYVIAFLQVFERAPIRFGARVALTEQAFGAAVSLGGAGSLAIGAWMLIERGAQPTRVAERSAVLFLLTSGVNVITLGLAGLGLWIGVLPGPRDPLLSAVPAVIGFGVLAFFLVLPALAEGPIGRRAPGRVTMLLEASVQSVRDTRKLLFTLDWRLSGAIAFLWCDIAVLVACFAATGRTPPLASIVLAYQIGYLSNIIPIPGSIGVLDGSLVGMLVIYGVNATDSTAATVVYHSIALWVPALWGTIAFVLLRLSKNKPLTLRPPRAERKELRAERRAARKRD